jgi:tripartite-type tricarboxylate transporter receptor subunit TctC
MQRITRRAALALPALLPMAARAQGASWQPERNVRIVVPFGPGTLADGAARLLAEHLQPRLGRPVIVENKGGATTTLGAAEVARAAPDGHTLLMAPPPFVLTQFAMPRLPYDPETAFRPVALVASSPTYLAVRGDLPAKDVAELVALARARPGALTYASVGVGSQPHVAGELFRQRAGNIDILHVPYATGVLAGNDLVAGRVDMVFTSLLPVRAFLEAGRVRLLAVAAPRRLPQSPDVPTLAEAGLAVRAAFWIGLLAPARTPDAAVTRWNTEVNAILADPAIVERLARLDLTPLPGPPEAFATLLAEERQQWGAAIRAAGIRIE